MARVGQPLTLDLIWQATEPQKRGLKILIDVTQLFGIQINSI